MASKKRATGAAAAAGGAEAQKSIAPGESGAAAARAAAHADEKESKYFNEKSDRFNAKFHWRIAGLPEEKQKLVFYSADRAEPEFHADLHGKGGCNGFPLAKKGADVLSWCDEPAVVQCDPLRIDRFENVLNFCESCCAAICKVAGETCAKHVPGGAAGKTPLRGTGAQPVAAIPSISQSVVNSAFVSASTDGAASAGVMAMLQSLMDQMKLSRQDMQVMAERLVDAQRAATEARREAADAKRAAAHAEAQSAAAVAGAAAAGAGAGRAASTYVGAALEDAKASAGKVFAKTAVKEVGALDLDAPEKVIADDATRARETTGTAQDWLDGCVERRYTINPVKTLSGALVPMADRKRAEAANTDPRAAKTKTAVDLWGSAEKLRDLLVDEFALAVRRAAELKADPTKTVAAEEAVRWLKSYVNRYIEVVHDSGSKALEWHMRVMQHAHVHGNGDAAVAAASEWLSASKRGGADGGGWRGGGSRGRGRGGKGGQRGGDRERFGRDKAGKLKCKYTAEGKECPNGASCRYSHEK